MLGTGTESERRRVWRLAAGKEGGGGVLVIWEVYVNLTEFLTIFELFSLSSPAFIFRGDNQRCHAFRVASRRERKYQN